MGTETDRLRKAAERMQVVLERVGSGVVHQVAGGELTGRLSAQEQVDLADLLDVATERLRYTRVMVASVSEVAEHDGGHAHAARPWLPLNRKERYYTGTVLPMLVASDGFAHLHRLLELCGLGDVRVDSWSSLETHHDLTFFTEYGFAESVFTDADKEAWPDLAEADTPDVVIAGPDWLLAIEAKMFHNPGANSLNQQMDRQRVLVDYWARTRGLGPSRVRHVLLLPEPLAGRVGPLAYDVVTWQQVLERYQRVAPRHWVGALATALERHAELESRTAGGGKNAHAMMTGRSVVEQHADGTLDYDHIGRNGGPTGKLFTEDIASGTWRTVRYEVRQGPLPANRNWFPISLFLASTVGTDEIPEVPQ